MSKGVVTLEGRLCSGLGQGVGFTALDWVEHQFHSKLGFWPHPGTFNLSLSGLEWENAREAMQSLSGIAIEPPPGFCAAKCFVAILDETVTGAAILPEVPDYPADKLELVAPVSVRQTLSLRDGDRVKLRIDIK